MAGELAGRIALITGGAAGIGRAIAELAAREGARVVVGDVNTDGGEETARHILKQGGEAIFQHTDVRKMDDIAALAALAQKTFAAPADTVFANAGIEGQAVPAWTFREADFTRVIDINLTGVWRVLAATVPAMIEAGRGSFVATSSVAGLVGAGSLAAYVASKHGVAGLVKSAAIDAAKSGVRVNAICPGMVETSMVERLSQQVEGLEEALLAMKPMGRLGSPAEIAEAAVWLSSDRASFITGHLLAIDGGYVAQ
jgi:NAD(P)-dependent dehydrogenase (short-subunit alcohol dehydrogenase family)